jgi:hypothetical protein
LRLHLALVLGSDINSLNRHLAILRINADHFTALVLIFQRPLITST